VLRPSRLTVLALSVALLAACGGSAHQANNPNSPAGTDSQGATASVTASPSSAPSTGGAAPASPAAVAPTPQNATSSAPAATGASLPLTFSTGSATQVITVVAAATSSTTATLQAWDKGAAGWVRHGGAVSAYVGTDGLTSHPSESISATPIGSFTLSRAFGSLANPGTGIPYHQTTSADWWISQYGGAYASIYNTMQTCSSSCSFNLGDPNEHLAAITPEYRYAVVIDYNTTAPIVQGGGSAFFLHVANAAPTAGCVSIPQSNLVAIMQWLNPAAQPRILIGVG
jgi:L,D-peptidoglycan transpeptidase YkuD (ErfK/YbiS/YcfS/YnhG family)